MPARAPESVVPVPRTVEETDDSFRLLVEQVVDYAIYHLDLRGRVSSWNVGAQRIKGYAPPEILGRHFSVFFTDEDRAQERPARILEAASTLGRHEEEGWRVRKDGSRFLASAVVTALRDESGRLRGFAKITRDLTQRQEVEQASRGLADERAARLQIEQAEQERRRLLRRQSDLDALRADVSSMAAADGEAAVLLERTARAMLQRLGVAAAAIWIFDDEGALRPEAHAGVPLPAGFSPDELAGSVVGGIARTGAPAVAPEPPAGLEQPQGRLSFAGCPLMAGAGTLGVIGVFGRGALAEDTLDVLRGVADVLAHSLERRQAEVELRRSRDQLAVILSTISDGVTAQGLGGRLVFANEAAARLTGFASAADMLAAPVRELVSRFELRDERGEPLAAHDLPGRRALEGLSSQTVVRFRNLHTGAEHWSQIAAAPVLGENGEVELAVNVFTDVTERKRTEEAWRFLADASATLASSLSYESTLAAVARLAVPRMADWCAVDVLGDDGTLQTIAVAHLDPAKVALVEEFRRQRPRRAGDPGVVEVLRTGQAQLIPQVPDELITAATDPAQRELIRGLGLRSVMVVPVVVGEKPFGTFTFGTAESGRRYDAQDLILAQEVARRASLAIENARAYRDAREAVRMRDTFLSIASHELKTPLSSLMLLLSGLLRSGRDGRLATLGTDKLVDRLQRIEEQADRLAELMNQLLDVSRLAAGSLALVPSETDLVEVAREVLARFTEDAGQAGAVVSLQEGGPVMGLWDRSRLDQMVTNLLTNAFKYGGATPVTVTVSADAFTARLSVTDRGPGIPEADQARIFEQYERAASINLGGLGLGLWLVRQLVHAHGGEVSVQSRPGEGASFTLKLPRRRAP